MTELKEKSDRIIRKTLELKEKNNGIKKSNGIDGKK